jgi:hypothetical protein
MAMSLLILQPAYATTLVVSNNNDLINGSTSNPAALIANPGSDGISLAEAILAVHGAPGPHTVTFASALSGQTIALTRGLILRQDNVTILGLAGAGGSPAIAIDANNAGPIALEIEASNISVTYLRFVRARQVFTVRIRAGAIGSQAGPQKVDRIDISDNAFDNSAYPNSHSNAISVGMDDPASNANLGNVTIARNTFANYTGEADGIHIPTGGTNNVIHDIVVSENRFTNITFPVELVHASAAGSRITGVQVVGNTFSGNGQAVSLASIGGNGQPATKNVIDGTRVVNNTFTNNSGVGVSLLGGFTNATDNAITNTTVTNNTFTANGQGVGITGATGADGQPVTSGNVVDGTRIAGNTFSNSSGAGVSLYGGTIGAANNTVRNTTIANNTFTASGQAVLITGAFGSDAPTTTTSGNGVSGTQIIGNLFANNRGPSVSFLGGKTNATGNATTNTTIANNVIHGSTTFGGVAVIAGRTGGRLNRNDGISIVNNTISRNVGGGVVVNADPERAGGNNTSSGISVINSIVVGNLSSFDGSTQDFAGLDVGQVSVSLVGQSEFRGGPGNISGDPKFVNASQGDFHLQAGSPAIDVANSVASPLTDLDGSRRIDDPSSPNRGSGPTPYVDIGAYEYGGAPAVPPTVNVAAAGPITRRTIGLSVTPPAAVQSQMGSVFVVAVLPPAQGSRVYAMAANGGWGAVTSCDSAPDAYSGPLRAALQIPVISESDLSQVQGVVIQVGYGIGSTAAAACTDMLNYSTIKAVYTIN